MISLNFLPFKTQNFSITIYRKIHTEEKKPDAYYHNFIIENGERQTYEIKFTDTDGFERYTLTQDQAPSLIAKGVYHRLLGSLDGSAFFVENNGFKNRKIHFLIESHAKGKKCVWVEPYFLQNKSLWGLLIDFHFVVEKDANNQKLYSLDKDILIASGTLNSKGNSNADYFLFKYNYLIKFIKKYLVDINNILTETVEGTLIQIESNQLAPKNYLFGNGGTSNSSFMGLSKGEPLRRISENVKYYFIYKKDNRDIAASLLRGLRGESNPATFAGMERLFKANFSNEVIKGASINSFDDETINAEILNIKSFGDNVIPIIITNSKKDDEDDRLYYWLKHKFTNAGIPCQVVTKDLIKNDYSIKYSLSNIGLQIFCESGRASLEDEIRKPRLSHYRYRTIL